MSTRCAAALASGARARHARRPASRLCRAAHRAHARTSSPSPTCSTCMEQTSINAVDRGGHDVRDPLRRHRPLGGIAGGAVRRGAGQRRCSAGARRRWPSRGPGLLAARRRPAQRPPHHARRGCPPFIATLGMMSVARGLALAVTDGRPVSGFDAGFRQLATGARAAACPCPCCSPSPSTCWLASSSPAPASAATCTRSAATRRPRACRGVARALPQDDGVRAVGADERAGRRRS